MAQMYALYCGGLDIWNQSSWNFGQLTRNYTPRTNIPFLKNRSFLFPLFRWWYGMESVRFIINNPSNPQYMTFTANITDCDKLKFVHDILETNSRKTTIYLTKLPMLEEIRIKNASYDVEINDSPFISIESLRYLIENAANTVTRTVTVHPDVYAKLADENNTEWHAVWTAAQTRQISFATS